MFMINKDILAKVLSFWYFYRWHPEVALRYLPIVDEINKSSKTATILDVGSGGLGIAPYLKRVVTGIDLHFHKPYHPLLRRVKGSVLNLPFQNNNFDIVVCVDMLEHLDKRLRKKAIMEMMRLAKKKLILAVPCGRLSYEQDRNLNQFYKKNYGRSYHFLDEQESYGLPDKEDIIDMVTVCSGERNKEINLKVFGNENLHLRYFLMKGWIAKNIFLEIFFRKIMLLIIPFLKILNQSPVYRQIFIVTFKYENSN